VKQKLPGQSALVVQGARLAQGVFPSTHAPPPSTIDPHTGESQPLSGLQGTKVAHDAPSHSGSFGTQTQSMQVLFNWQSESDSHSSGAHTTPSPQTALGVYTQPVAGSQESVVQASPSSQTIGVYTQPEAGSQESDVQALPSSQAPSLGA